MQWTDCEMVWRRASGWPGEAALPVAANPAHPMLGPGPNCLLMVSWENRWQVRWVRTKRRSSADWSVFWASKPHGLKTEANSNCRVSSISEGKQRGSVKLVGSLHLVGFFFFFCYSPGLSQTLYPLHQSTILGISVSSCYFFKNENNAMSITKHKMLAYSR